MTYAGQAAVSFAETGPNQYSASVRGDFDQQYTLQVFEDTLSGTLTIRTADGEGKPASVVMALIGRRVALLPQDK
jgi:hypothetical protein